MSRWAHDPDAAADALIVRSLDDIAVAGRVLLAGPGPVLRAAVCGGGAECVAWSRRLSEGAIAAPWPPPGPFDLAFLRLPKARDEQAMTAHAVLAALRPGGRLILYGGNDEGIRSATGMLKAIADAVTTLAVRGHGRVLAAQRRESSVSLRGALADWRTVTRLEIAGRAYDWISYPGCFAAGRIDEGTALLLSALPPLAAGARVLDYGCGTGVIAAAVLAQQPGLAVYAMDNDTVALEALGENVPAARPVLGLRLADAGRRRYDAIFSNPPLHRGIAEDRTQLEQLASDAPAHLAPGGLVQLVVPRHVPVDRLLRQRLAEVETVAETGRYRVWRARAAA